MSVSFEKEFGGKSFIHEANSLFKKNYDEIERDFFDGSDMNIDEDKYIAAQEAGLIRIFTARNNDKEMVGYIVYVALKHNHSKDKWIAQADNFYIAPDYRKGFTAFKMIKYANEELKKDGIFKAVMSSTIKHDISKLLERIGFQKYSEQYEIKLEG